ncbi:MAG: hypothetical protein AUI14_17425 [Actinobacteria bacterium 13_2_20CM_2_71_6]|nr:MAG: hypothetical protein AUI14_17425 [Actinobacteria bacterium 13_2_20CM_2_71_6]
MDERLRGLNEEIRALVARRGQRGPAELLPELEAIMRRYGVVEPSTEGLMEWIDKAMAERAAQSGAPER